MKLSTQTLGALAIAAASSAVSADVVTEWNQIALKASDVAGASPPVQARAMAVVHASIYEAVNAIDGRHQRYAVEVAAKPGALVDSAAAGAAHRALVRLFPQQQATLDAALAASMAAIPAGPGKNDGLDVGREAADKLAALRQPDGWDAKAGYTFSSGPGLYQATPPMAASPVLPGWGRVKPFVLKSASQFPFPGPKGPTSEAFARDLAEVRSVGGRSSTQRTQEQTAIAIHWAGSEIPPINAVARAGSNAAHLSVADDARLFALLNMAMADALIAVFDAKYQFNSWRPVTAIRGAVAGGSAGDAAWEPLLVTPPHPEYPSAHCIAVGAGEVVMRSFFGDAVKASYVHPPLGVARSWSSLSQLSKEVEDSRVWAGIHFRTAVVDGTEVGHRIGDYAVSSILQPVSR
jgi:hypothetical protein